MKDVVTSELSEQTCGEICRHKMKDMVTSELWSSVVMLLVIANVLVMAAESDYPDWRPWGNFDNAFLILFTVDILLRLGVLQSSFFTSRDKNWNIFDLVIVLVCALDWLVKKILADQGIRPMSALRSFRIIRIVRAVRLLHSVKHLWVLMLGFMRSMQFVGWILLLFTGAVFVSAILCTTVIGHHSGEWGDDASEIRQYFGTLLHSMVTLFQIVTLDNWSTINSLISERMPLMSCFFITYVLVMGFAISALVTGVITEQVTSAAKEALKEQDFGQLGHLEDAFANGPLAYKEFANLLREPGMTEMVLGEPFDAETVQELFRILDHDGNGFVTWEELRRGIRYAKGPASARQLFLCRHEMGAAQSELMRLKVARPVENEFSRRMEKVEHKLESLAQVWKG